MFPKPLSYNKFVFSKSRKFNEETFNNYTGGFNLSAGTEPFNIDGRYYNLFCTRYYTIKSCVFDREIIPGNMKCEKYNLETEIMRHIKDNNKSFYSTYKNISEDDYGKNYVWSDWENKKIELNSKIFIGEITSDNNITEIEIINEEDQKNLFEDSRILYIKSIEYDENKYIYIYVIFPRCLVSVSAKYYFYFIKYDDRESKFKYFRQEESTNLCPQNTIRQLNTKSINTECYKYEIFENKDTDYNYIKFYFFNWYENKCITQFRVNSKLLNDSNIIDLFTDKKKKNYIEPYIHMLSFYESMICVLKINNEHLNGDIQLVLSEIEPKKKVWRIKNMEMSFGTPFINVNNNDNLIAVGHGKLFSNKNIYIYKSLKLNRIQDLIPKILRKLFGNKFKQHHGSFEPPCVLGYNYFSYFIKYNDKLETYYISDFFIPIDFSDKYHFSLIFTVGIFNIGNNTYITSGEGDFYNSIIKYNTNDILCSCNHNVLDKNFNFDDMNFYFLIKHLDGTIENLLIDDSSDINNLLCK